jgi:hypothetical protein
MRRGGREEVLQALAGRRLGDLSRSAPSPRARRKQLAGDLDSALKHLRSVHDYYWDHDWRREHRGLGRYPEHDLWEAVDCYLELRDAAKSLTESDG